MTKIETFKQIMNGELGIETISDAEKHVDYAKQEIEISERILLEFKLIPKVFSYEALRYIQHILDELNGNIEICKSFIIWQNTLVYRKIQELYGVYQRENKDEIKPINLSLDSDLAYLRNIVKRDIRKNCCMDEAKYVLDVEAAKINITYTGKFFNCIELYNPSTNKGLVWNPKTKSIEKFFTGNGR